ncbi:MAG: ABC transporter ATP-binding protein, partial [Leptospiraceae bacterium]|nr:ABC transporter ATP-binding protein [Leptospiraceae bacterium]
MSNLPDREKSRNLRSLRFAFAFLRPYGGRLLLSGVALLFTAGVTLSLGFGLRYMIDHGFATGSLEALNQAILQFVGLAFLMAGGTFIRHYLVSWLGERVSADIRKAVFARVIELNPSFFETNVTGEIQTRITTDTSILQSVIGSSASIALRNAIMFVGGVAAMFVTDPMLTGIVLVCVPLAIGPILFFGRQVRRHARNSQDRLAEVGAYVGEALRGIKTVQANNHQELDRRKFN